MMMTTGEHRARRRSRWRDWAAIVAAILVATMIAWATYQIGVLRAQNEALANALDQQRRQAQDSGQDPVAPPADEIIRDPQVVTGPEGPQGLPGRDATDDQVRRAVEAYFARNPPKAGRPPNPAEIAVAVINYLTEHPPAPGKDGKDATPEQVAGAVRSYLVEHPPPPGPKGDKGDKGDRGEQGPGPTAQQIADQVEAYLSAHPLPLCPAGSHIEEYKPALEERTFLVCTKEG